MHIPPKGKKSQKMVKNGKKCQKITNNCKISEIMKYGEKNLKNSNNVKKCQKRAKNGQKMAKFQKKVVIVFLARNYLKKMVLAVFTRCLVPEIHIFGNFWLKSAFLGPNFSRTKICTAKPMILGYKGQFLRPTKMKEILRDIFFVV